MKYWLWIWSFFLGMALGAAFTTAILGDNSNSEDCYYNVYVGGVFGGLILLTLTIFFLKQIVTMIENFLHKCRSLVVWDILCGTLGLILALIVDVLIRQQLFTEFKKISEFSAHPFFSVTATCLLGYFGWWLGYSNRKELMSPFQTKPEQMLIAPSTSIPILDTSVIIDGRIADICRVGFLTGELVVPRFVLNELQHIADSQDIIRRSKGRRGLDILNQIRQDSTVSISIYDEDNEEINEITEVDGKLIKLAQILSGQIVTTDFNLNKVCELQGIGVLNINDLAKALKPVFLPGEELTVQVIKSGKEQDQGIAYLDDGTMIVIYDGNHFLGDKIDIIVTSLLQTSAGRMIFAKPKKGVNL